MLNFCQNRAHQNYLHPFLALNLPHPLRTACQSGEGPRLGAWKNGRGVDFKGFSSPASPGPDVTAKTKAQPETMLPPCTQSPTGRGILALTQHLHLPGEVFCLSPQPTSRVLAGTQPSCLPPCPVLHLKVFCRRAPQENPGIHGRLVFSGHNVLKILLVQYLSVELLEFTR